MIPDEINFVSPIIRIPECPPLDFSHVLYITHAAKKVLLFIFEILNFSVTKTWSPSDSPKLLIIIWIELGKIYSIFQQLTCLLRTDHFSHWVNCIDQYVLRNVNSNSILVILENILLFVQLYLWNINFYFLVPMFDFLRVFSPKPALYHFELYIANIVFIS